MNEPPSQELVRQLTELQLCHPSDLKRAGGRVRRLSYDLPSFDSVWIDSLVQLRFLSLYQARQFEQGHGEKLRLGSFVAIDELGRRPQATTYLAQRLNRRDRVVVKSMRIEPDRMEAVIQKLQQVLEQAKGFAHPQIVLPIELFTSSDREINLVTRYVPGLPLNELLNRRGRFPAAIVLEIGRQLLDGLAAIHSRSLIHGDIRMSNVLLTDQGTAVLVNGGIQPVIHPEITIHDNLAYEAYDGMAPELIGTGSPATATSELYALGCLLWQLLAGRPPFTTADPLAKLASHQTKRIEDVRIWAPDTPSILADSIRQMTSPNSNDRPRGFDEVLQRWRRSNSFSRSRLKQFRRLFSGGVPHFIGPVSSERANNRVWIALTLITAGCSAALMYDAGLRTVLLEIAQNVRSATLKSPPTATKSTTTDGPAVDATKQVNVEAGHGILPLPKPTSEGLVLLDQNGPYEVDSFDGGSINGELIIRGANGVKPVLLIDDAPLSLRARSVTLERLSLQRKNESDSALLVTIRSQRLSVVNCEFLAADFNEDFTDSAPATTGRSVGALGWTPNQPGSVSGKVTIEDTTFHGTGAAILLAKTPESLRISNVLKAGPGAFVTLGSKCIPSATPLRLEHVTLRESGPLLKISGLLAEKVDTPPFQIEGFASVLKPAHSKFGLIVVDSEQPRDDIAKSVEMHTTNCVIAPGIELMTAVDPSRQSVRVIDFDEQVEGVTVQEVEFAGTRLYPAIHCKTDRLVGPRLVATELPGIDPIRLEFAK